MWRIRDLPWWRIRWRIDVDVWFYRAPIFLIIEFCTTVSNFDFSTRNLEFAMIKNSLIYRSSGQLGICSEKIFLYYFSFSAQHCYCLSMCLLKIKKVKKKPYLHLIPIPNADDNPHPSLDSCNIHKLVRRFYNVHKNKHFRYFDKSQSSWDWYYEWCTLNSIDVQELQPETRSLEFLQQNFVS